MKKIMSLILIIAFLLPIKINATDKLNMTENAKASIMIESTTREIIFSKNEEEQMAVASLTKMMSLILFFEFIEKGGMKLDEKITVSENAKNMGGTQIYLEVGEKISINDLLKGITMASANDATVALAERVAGTEKAFVGMMNTKAQELGLKNTKFQNSTGLDENDHYSTAHDMAIIAKELLKHEEILKYSSVYESYIRKDTENKTWVVNTNKLVRFYEGADGLKTGFTDNAGSCIAVTAERDNLRFIVIALGYKQNTVRNEEARSLLDYGFNIYKMNVLEKKGSIIGITKLDKAKKDSINLILKEDASVLEKKTDQNRRYQFETEILDINYPIKKSNTIGYLIIKSNGKEVKKIELTTNENVDKANMLFLYLKNLKDSILGIN